MKVLVKELAKEQTGVKAKRSTYGIGLVRNCVGVSIDLPSRFDVVWTRAMELVEGKGFAEDKLRLVGSSIRQAIGWDDLVDSLSVHVYIARNQYEVVVEEKRKSDDVDEGTSKRANKMEKTQQPKPRPEVPMKEKGKAPTYKL